LLHFILAQRTKKSYLSRRKIPGTGVSGAARFSVMFVLYPDVSRVFIGNVLVFERPEFIGEWQPG